MPRFVASFVVILALLPITDLSAKPVTNAVDRVELPQAVQHGDAFGLTEAPRAEAGQVSARRVVLARLVPLPDAPVRVMLAASPSRPRFDVARRRRPERRARAEPGDPAH